MTNYSGILFLGQPNEIGGRGISGFRLRTVAANLGIDILSVDYTVYLKVEQIIQLIEKFKDTLKFIGFSTNWIISSTVDKFPWMTEEFFKRIKTEYPNIKIITGGHDEWGRRFLLKYSDYHFHGYSDNTFAEFLKMIHGREFNLPLKRALPSKCFYINSNSSNPVTNPDEIETVLLPEDGFLPHQPVPIEISRGCIFRCGFCRNPFLGKKDYNEYQRTPESIARELRRNYELFGTTRYTILDDTFNDSIEKISRVKKAVEIAKLPNFEFVSYIRPELLVTKPEMIPMLLDLGLKSAFCGIESFKKESRKSVGRGTDLNKVLVALSALAAGGVHIHASFIVGLPYESVNEVKNTHSFLINNVGAPFRSWYWEPLGIRNTNNNLQEDSIFDKSFSEYGYTIPKNTGNWSNEHFTSESATALSKELNINAGKFRKIAGWSIAGAWHIGLDDDTIRESSINWVEFSNTVNKYSNRKALEDLERLLR